MNILKQHAGIHCLIKNNKNKFLLLERAYNEKLRAGKWDLPGGGLDSGENIYNGLKRKMLEGTGLEISDIQVLACYEEDAYSTLQFLAVAKTSSRNVQLSSKYDSHKWLTLSDILILDGDLHVQALHGLLNLKKRVLFLDEFFSKSNYKKTSLTDNGESNFSILLEQEIGIHCLVKDKDKFLIMRRSNTDTYAPATWDLPGGGLEPRENIYKGLVREVKEEAGVEVKDIQILAGYEESEFRATQLLAIADYVAGKVKLSYEHDRYKWVDFDELLKISNGCNQLKACQAISRLEKRLLRFDEIKSRNYFNK